MFSLMRSLDTIKVSECYFQKYVLIISVFWRALVEVEWGVCLEASSNSSISRNTSYAPLR